MNESPRPTRHWATLVLGLAVTVLFWLLFLWPMLDLGYGVHPSRVGVTDQTTDTSGTEFNKSFFDSLQSNMENDIEDHRHTGGVEGRVLNSNAMVSLHLDRIPGTLDSTRILPTPLTFSHIGGTLQSGRLDPNPLTFEHIGGLLLSARLDPGLNISFHTVGQLQSSRITPTLDVGLHTVGTLDSSRVAGSVVNGLGSQNDAFASGAIRLSCPTWVQCPRTGQTFNVHLNSLRTQTILLTGAGGAPTTNQGSTAVTKLYQSLSSTDFFGVGLASIAMTSAFWNVVLPNSYQANSVVSFRVLWYPTGGVAGEAVQFDLRGKAFSDGAGINDTGTGLLGGARLISVRDSFIGLNSIHRTDLASQGLTILGDARGGSYTTFMLTRQTSGVGGTDLRSHAYVLGVELLYALDSFSDR